MFPTDLFFYMKSVVYIMADGFCGRKATLQQQHVTTNWVRQRGWGKRRVTPYDDRARWRKALCSAPWTPLTHRRACRAWPSLNRGKCLTPLILMLTNPIMLLTHVRLLCDFCIVWISKCLCGCCFLKPRDFLSPFNCDFCIVWISKCLCF